MSYMSHAFIPIQYPRNFTRFDLPIMFLGSIVIVVIQTLVYRLFYTPFTCIHNYKSYSMEDENVVCDEEMVEL